jgi:hypothetical protein
MIFKENRNRKKMSFIFPIIRNKYRPEKFVSMCYKSGDRHIAVITEYFRIKCSQKV